MEKEVIKKAESPIEYDRVVDIWLMNSKVVHDFIDPRFWICRISEMKDKYFPNSETYVYKKNGETLGYISLIGKNVFSNFVDVANQRNGIGQKLLNYVKDKFGELQICVYAKNIGAIKFYEENDFKLVAKEHNSDTDELQYVLKWQSS